MVSIVVTFNGCTTEYFHLSHGMRQGDPLSSLILNFGMTKLSMLILEVVSNGKWQDVFFHANTHISNMSFDDDVVIFGKASLGNIYNMLNTIDQFYQASGQRISFAKSQIISTDNLPPELEHFLLVEKGFFSKADSYIQFLGFPYIHIARHSRKMHTLSNKLMNKI